jgi:hypothetical protein
MVGDTDRVKVGFHGSGFTAALVLHLFEIFGHEGSESLSPADSPFRPCRFYQADSILSTLGVMMRQGPLFRKAICQLVFRPR